MPGRPAGNSSRTRRGFDNLVERVAADRIELFDLHADPNERRDLARQKPEVAAELERWYRRWNAGLIPPRRPEYQEVMDARQRALPPPRQKQPPR